MKSLKKLLSKIFICYIVLFIRGKIEHRLDGTYLVWRSQGLMLIPPMPQEIKLSDRMKV